MKLSLFFICLFIILNFASMEYYISNNEFYHYVFSDDFKKLAGSDWDNNRNTEYNINFSAPIKSHVLESQQNAIKNISYNKILIWIYYLSSIGILLSFIAYHFDRFKNVIYYPLKNYFQNDKEKSMSDL